MNEFKQIIAQLPEMAETPFATVFGKEARVRIMTVLKIKEKLYIVTGKQSNKINELTHNSSFETCYCFNEEHPYWNIRLRGKAIIVEDPEFKTEMFNSIEWIKHYWNKPEHPLFTVVECAVDEIEFNRKGKMEAEIVRKD
jgi:uncharacterized pyridoxamine 5'-phosphate oxidase family protein